MKVYNSILTLGLLLVLPSVTYGTKVFTNNMAIAQNKGIEYRAPWQQVGMVEAWHKNKNRMIWRKQIYVIRYNIHKKKGTQKVTIQKLRVLNKLQLLRIVDSKGRVFLLHLKTLQVVGPIAKSKKAIVSKNSNKPKKSSKQQGKENVDGAIPDSSVVYDLRNTFNFLRVRAVTTNRLYRIRFCAKGSNCKAIKGKTSHGLMLSQQGASSSLTTAFATINKNAKMKGLEKRRQDLKKLSKHSKIEKMFISGVGWKHTAEIYIKPDGRISYCKQKGKTLYCTAKDLFICIRSQIKSFFSLRHLLIELHIKWNGTIALHSTTKTRKHCK